MALSTSCEQVLRLSAVKGLGLKTFHHLYTHFGSLGQIFAADFQQLSAAGLRAASARALCEGGVGGSAELLTQRIQAWSTETNQHVLCLEDADYPSLLKEIYCPPPLIYVRGELSALSLPALALVGSRKASIAGAEHAYRFARDLSLQGYNIVSGLALGVDTKAHQGALSASGLTTAVLGTGLDVIYPKQNIALAERILEQGCLISEMPLGAMPVPANFPRRNRLISGLSQGVLIVEAGLKSGSLITANYALEQNREVYVIPGSIDCHQAAGSNALIQQGAQLVTCAEDINSEAVAQPGKEVFASNKRVSSLQEPLFNEGGEGACSEPHSELDAQLAGVYALIPFECMSFDTLVAALQQPPGDVLQSLVELELKGLISGVPGGYQRVKTVNSTLT